MIKMPEGEFRGMLTSLTVEHTIITPTVMPTYRY